MPVKFGDSTKAIRAGKGDLDGTTAIGADGMPYNIEFDRIYFGSDLKFDKYTSKYFVIRNTGSSAISVRLMKVGSTWNNTTAPTMVYCLPHDSIYRTEHAVSYNVSYNIPAGKMICFRNDNTTSGAGFSQSSENRLYFTLYGSGSASIEGKFSALAPAIYEADDIVLPDYCFYKLFSEGIPSALNTYLNTSPTNVEKSVSCGKYCFAEAFNGSSSSSKNGIQLFQTMEFENLGAGAFYKTFMFSNVNDTYRGSGSIYAENINSPSTNDSGTFESTFESCSNISGLVKLCRKDGMYADMLFSTVSKAYKRTFANSGITAANLYYIQTTPGESRTTIGRETFYQTFLNCTNLTYPLNIKYDSNLDSPLSLYTLGYGFYQTFCGCTNLKRVIYSPMGGEMAAIQQYNYYAPGLCAFKSGDSGHEFDGMYKNCTTIESADFYDSREDSYLPGAKNIRLTFIDPSSNADYNPYACQEMFYGCTGLTDMRGIFNSSSIFTGLCKNMFNGCTNLVYANVPNGISGYSNSEYCFQGMFYGCTGLVSVDGFYLPMTADSCCKQMFKGCTSLKCSPYLNAESIIDGAYDEMFYGCSSLECIITNQSQQGTNTSNWTYGVPTNTWRRYIKTNTSNSSTQKNASPNTSSANYIPYNWTIETNVLIFRSPGDFTIRLEKNGNPASRTINYILLDSNATTQVLPFNTNISVSANKIMLVWSDAIGNDHFSTSTSNYYRFQISTNRNYADVYCHGKLTALTRHSGIILDDSQYTFSRLFYNNPKLISAPVLNLSTSNNYRYYQTFLSCTGLKYLSGVTGHAATIATFYMAFRFCTALESPLDLSSITSIENMGFAEMYYGCSNLKQVSRLNPNATIGTYAFSYMYGECSSIEFIPFDYLPYTTLSECCYAGMFSGCSSLRLYSSNLLNLPATTLANGCYRKMFENCINIIHAPDLPATTLVTDCYEDMFKGCTSLQRLSVSFTDWGNNNGYRCTKNWVYNVPNGNATTEFIFYHPSSLSLYYNNSGNTSNSNSISGYVDTTACYIPYNWTHYQNGSLTPDTFRFERVSGTTTIAFNNLVDYKVSRNGYTWTNPSSTMSIDSSNTRLCIKYVGTGTNIPKEDISISGSGTINVKGNICYLSSVNNTEYNLSNFFNGCTNIRDCSEMYFDSTLTINAYRMFYNSGVTKVKKELFHNVRLSSAQEIFRGCTSLQYGADCVCYNDTLFSNIFNAAYYGCTSLRSRSSDNTTLHFGSSKTISPIIGAHSFENVCYGCSSSYFNTVVIDLTSLGDSLTRLYTFTQAFYNCLNLNAVYTRMLRWPNDSASTTNWLKNVKSTGNFYVTQNSIINTSFQGPSRIPMGWILGRWTPS